MLRHSLLLLLGSALTCLTPCLGLASTPYEGDASIYQASSSFVRPNVLLIIDNSSAAQNGASGSAYDPATVYTGAHDPYDIYVADQQGDFARTVASNSTDALENLACTDNNEIVKTTLLAGGTYTGSGTDDYPGLKAHQGNANCDRKAGTYALGNYLNYLESDAEVGGDSLSQAETVYQAAATVLGGARFAVNFGTMVYGSNNKGGAIISEVANLTDDSAFQTFLTKLPGSGHADAAPFLTSETARPQAEALFDAGYYFRGEILPVSQQAAMTSPITAWCQKNYVILITNGLSNKDDDPGMESTVGDYDSDAMEEAPYGLGSHYLDDVAKFNYEEDVSDLEGIQRVSTHTILAFQNEDSLVKNAADANHGRGSFHNVFDANELAQALTKVLINIVLEADTSFVAPVVPTSPENRTYSGDRVYMGFFKPITQKPWHGNLKKFGLNGNSQVLDKNGAVATNSDGSFNSLATSYWSSTTDAGQVEEGGAGEVLLSRNFSTDPRKIYTYLGSSTNLTASSNAFDKTNISSTDLEVADTAAKDALVDYIYGYDAYDEDGDGSTTDKREWILGDILHSKPTIVNYNTYAFTTTNESNSDVNKTMIYVGTNDGMLHAFRDSDGKEMWAFVPPAVFPNLKGLSDVAHNYFVDASPEIYIYDKDNDGNIGPSEASDGDSDNGYDDKVILLFGQRRGGGTYYALDVTNPLSPQFLWKIDNTTTGFGELGQSWSVPSLGKIKTNGTDKIVAFIGAGYDAPNEDRRFGNTQSFTGDITAAPATSEGSTTSAGSATDGVDAKGRGIFAIEIATLDSNGIPSIASNPTLTWEFTPDTTNSIHSHDSYNRDFLNYSFPSDVTVLDTDFDGYTDRLYVGDTGGRMWRVSAHHYTDDNKPYATSDISKWFGKIIFSANSSASDDGRKIFYRPSVTYENGYIGVYFGTGDRAHPLNTAVIDRAYAVYDRGQKTSDTVTETDLNDITLNLLQENDTAADTINSTLTNLFSTSKYGWLLELDENSGEKILAPGLVFNKVAYFTTYAPSTSSTSDPCAAGNLGTSRLYAVDYQTGEAVLNFSSSNDSEETTGNTRAKSEGGSVMRRSDRATNLGVGIPSGIVMVMPANGDAKILIGCGGGLCSEDPVTGGTIIPIYWMKW